MQETSDHNKTALTHRITAVAAAYLDEIGCKPVETEVRVKDGWVADVASFVYPTMTEALKMKLIKRQSRRGSIRDSIDDWGKEGLAFRDVVYRHGNILTVIVEVKISKGDFAKDEQRKFRGGVFPAHLCYIAYPKGLLEDNAIPPGWIALIMSKDGRRLIEAKRRMSVDQLLHAQPPGDMIDFVATVAIRRAHRTRYRELRAVVNAYNRNETENKRQHNIQHTIKAIVAYLQGEAFGAESIRDLLKYDRVKIPKYLEDSIDWLEKLKAAGKEGKK